MAKTAIIFPEAKPSGNAGYTLAELLVVLVIIALSTAVLVPRLLPAPAGVSAQDGANQLIYLLKKTRQLALTTGISQAVTIDTKSKTAWLEKHQKIQFADDVEIETITAEPESALSRAGIRFFPDGVSSGAEIRISSAEQTYLVSVIWATAQIRLARVE